MKRNQEVFTTGEIAKICNVACRTISKWFDAGQLKGYRIPGSQDRRVPRANLLAFLRENGLPLGDLERDNRHLVMLVGSESWQVCPVHQHLPADEYHFEQVSNAFEAGIMYEEKRPEVVVIDLAMGKLEALHVAGSIAHDPRQERVLLLGLASEDEPDPERLTIHGFKEVWKKPVNPADVAAAIVRHFERGDVPKSPRACRLERVGV